MLLLCKSANFLLHKKWDFTVNLSWSKTALLQNRAIQLPFISSWVFPPLPLCGLYRSYSQRINKTSSLILLKILSFQPVSKELKNPFLWQSTLNPHIDFCEASALDRKLIEKKEFINNWARSKIAQKPRRLLQAHTNF